MSSRIVSRRMRVASVERLENTGYARRRPLTWVLNIGIAACATALFGCCPVAERGSLMRSASASESRAVRSIPPSVRALLDPQPAPKCAVPPGDANIDERQRLDYERQCYRQAEIIVRDRLNRLQAAVARMERAN